MSTRKRVRKKDGGRGGGARARRGFQRARSGLASFIFPPIFSVSSRELALTEEGRGIREHDGSTQRGPLSSAPTKARRGSGRHSPAGGARHSSGSPAPSGHLRLSRTRDMGTFLDGTSKVFTPTYCSAWKLVRFVFNNDSLLSCDLAAVKTQKYIPPHPLPVSRR